MLKALEERRDMLKRKLARTEERQKVWHDNFYATPAYDFEREQKFDEEITELNCRLRLYSDYEIIQNADEENIKSRLNEIADELIEEQNEIFDYCKACLKKNPDYAEDECPWCSYDIGKEPTELQCTEIEAYDMLDILDSVEVQS